MHRQGQAVHASRRAELGDGRFARAAGNEADFKSSPEFDGAVLALAASLIREMKLGADKAPDIIAVGLSATDYVGHHYGTEGQEMCLQMLSLDRDLGDFFRVLDSAGLDYAVALTADHGGLDIPERKQAIDPQAARVDPALGPAAMSKVLAARLGLTGPILHGEAILAHIYIDHALSLKDRARVRDAALAIYQAHPQVEAAFTAEQLRKTALPTTTPDRWTLIERARASFDPARSGDLVVLLHRDVTPIPNPGDFVATHGSACDYDRRVPLLLWRSGMPDIPAINRSEWTTSCRPLPHCLAFRSIARRSMAKCLLGVPGIACPPR